MNRRILVLLPIPLAAHTFPNLWNALRAFCSRFIISLLLPPCLSTVAPRYGNSSTSSTSLPFTMMLFLLLACPVLSVLHFLALSLRTTLAASSVSLLVLLCKSLNLNASTAMSSAKSRSSNTVVNFHHIPLLLFAVTFLMTQSRESKNRNPGITHPCFTPDLILNQSYVSLPSITAHSKSSYMSAIALTIFQGIP